MNIRRLSPLALSLSLTMLAACGSDGGSDANVPPGASESTSALANTVSSIPVVGELLGECTATAIEVVDTIVVPTPIGDAIEGVPVLGQVLVLGDPSGLPVLGALLEPTTAGDGFVPLPAADALALLPADADLASLPVLGTLPVSCNDATAGLIDLQDVIANGAPATGDLPGLPDPLSAAGILPVFDALGDPAGVLVVVEGLGVGGASPLETSPLPLEALAPLSPLLDLLSPILSLLGILGF